MKYKLLVLDVDGTLVNARGTMDPRDVEAIRKAASAGVKIALSTGRVPMACDSVLQELQLDSHHIFFDGALVSDLHLNHIVHFQPINRSDVLQAVEYSRSSDTYLEIYTHDNFYADRANWTDIIHQQFFGVSVNLADLSEVGRRKDVLKMETIARAHHEFEKAEIFRKRFGNLFRYSIARSPAFPGVDFINIIEPGVSKGNALVKLSEFMGLSLDETAAIGDGLNDISLLQTAGLGIAMGNAFPEVKNVADAVTSGIDEGGVRKAVNHFILG